MQNFHNHLATLNGPTPSDIAHAFGNPRKLARELKTHHDQITVAHSNAAENDVVI